MIRKYDGILSFLILPDLLMRWVDEVIQQIGGWETPIYIDVPIENANMLTLPTTYGSIFIESIGTDKVYLIDNVLYKVGFKVRVHHNDVSYRCTIKGPNLFEIWKSDRAKWTGETPYDAWIQVDHNFDENSIDAFGISCPVIQYEYKRLSNGQYPERYEVPNFNFYRTVSKKPIKVTTSKKAKNTKKDKSKKKNSIKKKKLSYEDYYSETDDYY